VFCGIGDQFVHDQREGNGPVCIKPNLIRAFAQDVPHFGRPVARSADIWGLGHLWATAPTRAAAFVVWFRWGNRGVPLQTLARLVKEEDGGVFDPEDIVVMATAFDRLLADLKLVDRNDPVVRMLAKLVIELVRNGERDPDKIRQQVVGRYKPQ
jgi:hypothetical protein